MIELVHTPEVLPYQCFCMDISLRFHQGNVLSFLFIFGAGKRMKCCSWLLVPDPLWPVWKGLFQLIKERDHFGRCRERPSPVLGRNSGVFGAWRSA